MNEEDPKISPFVTNISSNLRHIGPVEYFILKENPVMPDFSWSSQFNAARLGIITRTKSWEQIYLVKPGATIACGCVGEKDEHLHFTLTFENYAVVMVPGKVPHKWTS